MASSNPFRRKLTAAPDATASQSSAEDRYPTLDLSNIEPSSRPPPPTSFGLSRSSSYDTSLSSDVPEEQPKKKKVVKKVRVLSPPPLSPDSPEFPLHMPTAEREYFSEHVSAEPVYEDYSMSASTASISFAEEQQSGMPANPFSKTLQDLENTRKEEQLVEEQRGEGEVLKAANSGKVGMDVDAFRRLLLTGNSGQSSPAPSAQTGALPPGAEPPTGAEYGTKPVLHHGKGDGILPNPAAAPSKEKKVPPPPPPSSRHGRSLRLDVEDNSRTNSPKPASPIEGTRRPGNVEKSNQVDDTDTNNQKKAVPAPPPPRGHARAESKITSLRDATEPDYTGNNVPSRLESLRHPPSAPAPPPPRRTHTAGPSKQDSSTSSPTATTFPPSSSTNTEQDPTFNSSDSRDSTPAQSASGGTKLPPAPPPARNTSVRRPPSTTSIDSNPRRASGDSLHRPGTQDPSAKHATGHKELPPRPPPRTRGSFELQRSLDKVPRSRGINNVIIDEDGVIPDESGKGMDILKDLSALQREVDALRGKVPQD